MINVWHVDVDIAVASDIAQVFFSEELAEFLEIRSVVIMSNSNRVATFVFCLLLQILNRFTRFFEVINYCLVTVCLIIALELLPGFLLLLDFFCLFQLILLFYFFG